MDATTTNNVRNYFKLDFLIGHSNKLLCQLFKNRYTLFYGGKVWDDTSKCGKSYLSNVIAKNNKINLTPVQKTSICNGDSKEWDLTLLTALLLNTDRPQTLNKSKIQELDKEDALLKQLRDIRNKLAHNSSKSIDDNNFNQVWAQLTSILVYFGAIDTEMDKIKDDILFESAAQSVDEENLKEAIGLNSLGTQAHKEEKFSDAITLFTKAIVLSGVSDRDRAVFYSNLSSSRLALYEQQQDSSKKVELQDPTDQRYRALNDAKQARRLWPTWWKGHLRVGKVYATLNEHERAINSFERALALAPTNDTIQKALDESRYIYSRQLRNEHLDPRLRPITMTEHLNELQEKIGINPQRVRVAHKLLDTLDPVAADVVKGHKYEHGDNDVKQDYEQAAKYFAKAASQGNAEGMYNLARLTDQGLGLKKDHTLALKLFEQAASQPHEHSKFTGVPNVGVAAAEHALGLRYANGIVVAKSPATAVYWYERATEHGSAESANNLGIMYEEGIGVNKDLDKAEKLFNLSARRGDPNAMLSLAWFLFHKDDFEMAKVWYDRACGSGNMIAQSERADFEKKLQQKKQLIDSCSPNSLSKINALKNVLDSLKHPTTIVKQSNQPYCYDYNVLSKYANLGSLTAQRLCNALEHFAQVLTILMEHDNLNDKQEDLVVHELSECYRLEHIVASFPGMKMRQKIEKIVHNVLHRCSVQPDTIVPGLDEEVRLCYAILHMDSHKMIDKFLVSCKEKYPKSIYFYELSAAVNGWLGRFEVTLYNANAGLTLDPDNISLLYDKAVALRQLNTHMNEAITAYKEFLKIAPKDHRKVPESYYSMASCYLALNKHDSKEVMEKLYKEGEESEKSQLSCFLPYESNYKKLVKGILDAKYSKDSDAKSPPVDHKSRLTDPHRIEIIKGHREWEAISLNMKSTPTYNIISQTQEPRCKQMLPKSLIGLKPITLRQMDPTKDHVYHGYALAVTIIEEAYTWIPSIHLVIEDEHLDCERMFIYGFPEPQGQQLIRQVFTAGSKMNIISPYLRLGANDMKSLIRIDEFSSIVMQDESERVLNMCRCCGKPDSLHVCSKCTKARYCTKECQTMDWKLYKHKLVCIKQ